MTHKCFDPERAGPSATGDARQEFMSASEWLSTNRRQAEASIYTEVGEFRSPSLTEQLASTKSVYDPVGWQVSEWRRGYEHSMSVPISGKRFVCHIPEGKVAGVDGAVITPDGVLLTDVSLDFPTLLGGSHECHSYADRVNRAPTRRLTGTSVVLALLGGNNYFHWMAQLLPRLFLIENAGLQIANVDHFIVNGTSHPFQRETLERLGIASDRTVTPEDGEILQCALLVVPSLPPSTNFVARNDIEELQARLGFDRERLLPATRIYVPRRRVSHRWLENDVEVEKLLQYRGFVVVEPSEMSVTQQAACFRSADVIVAPHGAALTNLAFARRGTKIIEIFDPRFVNGCYALLSYVRDLDYYFVFGQRRSESDQDHVYDLGLRAQPPAPMLAIPSWENFNIVADLSSLEETLDHAGL